LLFACAHLVDRLYLTTTHFQHRFDIESWAKKSLRAANTTATPHEFKPRDNEQHSTIPTYIFSHLLALREIFACLCSAGRGENGRPIARLVYRESTSTILFDASASISRAYRAD